MISQNLRDGLSTQLNNEFAAAYTYLAMSAYCEKKNLTGFALWLREHSKEELAHGHKIFEFLLSREIEISYLPIKSPKSEFSSLVEVFEEFLAEELRGTEHIHQLYQSAIDEHQYEVQMLLQWYINEHIEEEHVVRTVVEQLRMIGDSGAALLMLDREMGARKATA